MKPVKLLYTLVVFITTCLNISCTQNESFVFQGKEGICFTIANSHYALGELPLKEERIIVHIPLERVGYAVAQDEYYGLQIDSLQSNVNVGSEIESLSFRRVWKANSLHDTLDVVINRKHLDTEKAYTLKLFLTSTEPLKPIIGELNAYTLTFTNKLEKPQWWSELSYWLGEYNPVKYQKYIEYAGSTITINDVKDHKYAVLRIFKQVKQHFEEFPQKGVVFPNVRWEV